MEKRAFGKTGLDVSVLGFGGAPVGFLDTDRKQVATIINTLLDKGVNLIDTAAGYPGSEEAIGEAVSHRRDEYVLVSKCGQAFDDLPGEAWSAEVISATVDRALRRLRTDHLDVMVLHGCDLEYLERGEAMGALAKARDAGKIRFAGFSGDNNVGAYAANLPDVAVIETSMNICDQANIEAMLPITREKGQGVLAKRPIANAAWRDEAEQEGFYKTYAATYHGRLKAMGITPEELGFDGDQALAWPEIALRFTLSQPGIHTAIVGTTKPSHVERNLEIAAKGQLPDAAVAKLREAFAKGESTTGETWSAQR